MRVFLPVIIFLIMSSVDGKPLETETGEFRRCFPERIDDSRVTVSCGKQNDTNKTQIAQFCDQFCRNMSKPGVFLEKEQDRLCLAIRNCSYDSWFCEARSFIDAIEQKDNFTVNFNETSCIPLHSGSDGYLWIIAIVLIISRLIPGLIAVLIAGVIYLYKKKKCCWKTNGNQIRTNHKDPEVEPRPEKEAMLTGQV